MNAPSFHVKNIGCRVNRVETDTIAAGLIDRGIPAAPLEQCSLVIINTCAVTGEAEAKTRKAIHQTLAAAPTAEVIVTGCAVALNAPFFESMDSRVHAVVDKSRLLERALDILCVTGSARLRGSGAAFSRTGDGFMCRAGIKIQDGCDNACTYCIVHVARGPLWSRPQDEVIAEVVAAADRGVHEVVLTGVNLGHYDGGCDIAELLECLLEAQGETRIRLSSIEPDDVTDALIDVMATAEGRVCRHLHLPLQSGCGRTLREMGRHYTAEGYLALTERLRSAMPRISLTTDIIAGFPGETDADFEESLALCRAVGFSKMHVFRYSRRFGTPAAARPDQIDPRTINARASRLRQLGSTMRTAFMEDIVGKEESVLIESGGLATTESYLPARIEPPDTEAFAPGMLAAVYVTGTEGGTLICRPLL